MDPIQVQMPAEKFTKLLAVMKWYDNMPGFLEVGDSFHERMNEEIDKLLADIPQIKSEEWYRVGLEENDGKLFLELTFEDDSDVEMEIELVSA